MECVFCKIVSGSIPSAKVYEDNDVLAFKDLNPQAPVHLLVIPKMHINSLDQVNKSNITIAAKVLGAIPNIARAAGLNEGYRVITNIGEHGCQSVLHLHFHIIGGTQLSERMN